MAAALIANAASKLICKEGVTARSPSDISQDQSNSAALRCALEPFAGRFRNSGRRKAIELGEDFVGRIAFGWRGRGRQSFVAFEYSDQRLAGARYAAFHGTHRAIADLRSIFVGEPASTHQDKCFALLIGQT